MVEIFNDIRKLYRFVGPCPELTAHIEFYSETSIAATSQYVNSENFSVKLFPSYTPTIWINLGSHYELKNGSRKYSINQKTDVLLLRNQIVERTNLPSDNIFTVKFNPGGFEAVFGFSQDKIGAEVINLEELIKAPLLSCLKSAGSFEDRIRLLQDFFLHKLKQQKERPHLNFIKKLHHVLENGTGSLNNCSLAADLNVGDKTFYRYFNVAIGTNPKTYFSIFRTRRALTDYVANPKGFSVYTYGYYDNSHFYKDVFKFTGQKLSAFKL
ncbi:helix-turn-helix domain-containing protein [Pedobacter nutrimenti]|uniref:Helix-turn-helix protein n=1 Tax=Pedobacter nutrimenti TaxID=1241337 RepID=A0A318UEX5_9SPHI|nr:helix-turn-helix domain-containing protein [Pedobacter nutrimenti]PYF72657.1 hypothetical protein B0O44_10524 [Pedobacter nutrimenti]